MIKIKLDFDDPQLEYPQPPLTRVPHFVPPVELEAELVADGLTPKRVPAVGVLVVALKLLGELISCYPGLYQIIKSFPQWL